MAPPGGDSGGEKTEKASPKKRQDERKKGNIFTSKDVTTVISLVASFFIMSMFFSGFIDRVSENLIMQITRAASVEMLDIPVMMEIFREVALVLATTILPAATLISMVSVAVILAQTKLLWSNDLLKFKWERLNPIKGIKKLFALRSLVELVKSLVKISVLIYILYFNIMGVLESLPGMLNWDVRQAALFAGDRLIFLVVSVSVAFTAIAALDYLYQRYEYEKGIKMSKQEVKDEYKQMEGSPEIKGARRQKQREYAMGRMMQAVEEADVVVRNPTHYAVALKYKLEVDPAPIVVAKGQDNIALKIIERAEELGISTVENRTLARGLYESAEIDSAIPGEFFQPVAELLAWLYNQKAARQKQ